MNIINKGFMKLALMPGRIYERFGIDKNQLRSILFTKLTIDDRRPNTIHQTSNRKKEKPITAATIGTILMSLLLGFVYLIAFTMGRDEITKLTFYFSFFFFMLASSLISDFTSVLIDVRDTYIILPRPVNDRTIVAGRTLHILIHISKLVVPMCAPGLVTVILLSGAWAGLCFLLMVSMLTLFTIFFINALYLLILKITTPQKFQSIISYVQIIFGVVLYASFQLLPRLMKNFEGISFSINNNPWFVLVPSYWFAAGFSAFSQLKAAGLEWLAAAISITLPFGSLYVVVKYLAPNFNNKLALINSGTSEATRPALSQKTKRWTYSAFLSRLFTKRGNERMGFLFTWKMSARSRDFRLKVYPAIGYLLVYVVIIMFQGQPLSMDQIENETGAGKTAIVTALYICSYLPMMAIGQAIYSDKFKAAWIYYTTPVTTPGMIIRGSVKASIALFFIPLAFIVLAAGLFVVGFKVLPNIVLGLVNQLLLACITVYSSHKQLPFSAHQSSQRKTGNFIRGLVILLASGLIGISHYLIYDFMPVVLIFTILSGIATWMLLDSIKNISWSQIVKGSYEV
jgi:hypothetical protein